MASVMAIESEVIGECVEAIRIEAERKVLRKTLMCLELLDWLPRYPAATVAAPS